MSTQREPQGEHPTYLLPPLSLEFRIFQERREMCSIQAAAHSGNHCFVRRSIDAYYDTFHEIPVMIASSMLSWTLWLVQFEAERRDPSQRKRLAPLARFPDWPRPEKPGGPLADIEF